MTNTHHTHTAAGAHSANDTITEHGITYNAPISSSAPLYDLNKPLPGSPLVTEPRITAEHTNANSNLAKALTAALTPELTPLLGVNPLKEYPVAKGPKRYEPVMLPSTVILPNGFKQDGVDHINIGGAASTKFGHKLSESFSQMFNVPVHGPFTTMVGFWHWLRSEDRDNMFRDQNAPGVRKLAQRKHMRKNVHNFRVEILSAHWVRINSIPNLRKEVMESALPFAAYYLFGPPEAVYAIEDRSAKWLVPGMEILRNAVKKNIEPDLSQFANEARPYASKYAGDTWRAAGIDSVRSGIRNHRD